jgi:hypothetical protein
MTGLPKISSVLALPGDHPRGGEPDDDRGAVQQAHCDGAVAAPPMYSLGPHANTIQEGPGPAVPFEGGWDNGTGPAEVIRLAVLRALAVVVLALAGLLVFGLLPGGRDTGAFPPGQHLQPAVPTVRSLHPHGPNRLLRHGS